MRSDTAAARMTGGSKRPITGACFWKTGQSVTLHFAYAGSANNWSSGNVYMTVSLALVSDCNSNSVPDECDILIETRRVLRSRFWDVQHRLRS